MDIRRLEQVDCAAWAELLACCFGRSQTDMMQLWQWFHAGYEVVAWGAWVEDCLAAQYSCLVSSLLLPGGNRPAPIGISTNMAVRPEFRGRGLIKQMAGPVYEELTNAGCIAGVGFSNAAGVKVDKHSQGYGYHVVGRLLPSLILPVWRARSESVNLTATWPALGWQYAPRDDGLVRFNATPAIVQHRYAAHPFRRYRFGIWQSDDKINGVALDRPTRLCGAPGVALLAAYADDLPGLLERWANTIRREGAWFIHLLTTPASPLLAAARGCGVWAPLPFARSPHYLTVKPLRAEAAGRLLDLDCWDCCGGDVL